MVYCILRNVTLTFQFRAVGGFQVYSGFGVVRHPPASRDASSFAPVFEHEPLATALRHARNPRTRPAYQRHVRVQWHHVRRVGRRVGHAVVLCLVAGVVVHRRDVVEQQHAIDAIFGVGERQPLVNADRPIFLAEHDQPPVVQYGHVAVDDHRFPVVRFARCPTVGVKRMAVRFKRLR